MSGFSVYHTVSEAECKTVQCMDSDRVARYAVAHSGLREKSGCSNHPYPFRRTAICGNSLHFLNKLRERHTWLFESATRNRVHVETASIFITPAARHATDGRHLRRSI